MANYVKIHISSHRTSYKCDNTLIAVVRRGREKVEGFNRRSTKMCNKVN